MCIRDRKYPHGLRPAFGGMPGYYNPGHGFKICKPEVAIAVFSTVLSYFHKKRGNSIKKGDFIYVKVKRLGIGQGLAAYYFKYLEHKGIAERRTTSRQAIWKIDVWKLMKEFRKILKTTLPERSDCGEVLLFLHAFSAYPVYP